MPPVRRTPDFPDGPGLGFKLWFALCAVLGVGLIGVLVWLIITVINWIGRH